MATQMYMANLSAFGCQANSGDMDYGQIRKGRSKATLSFTLTNLVH